MLWSYWKYSSEGLRSPKRPKAFLTRDDATKSIGPRHRARQDLHLVCLYLRIDVERGCEGSGVTWTPGVFRVFKPQAKLFSSEE